MRKISKLNNGDKFGRLTVIRYDGLHQKPCGTRQSKYLCRCDCGEEISVFTQNLKNGNTKSCGCYSSEVKNNKKLPNNKGVINQIILGYKRHAKRRNIEWKLSYEEVSKIISMPCFYCGTDKSNIKITKNCKDGFKYSGIDRIDSKKDYSIDNVVPCCKICNMAKSDMDKDDFILWVNKVANYQKAMAEQWTKGEE